MFLYSWVVEDEYCQDEPMVEKMKISLRLYDMRGDEASAQHRPLRLMVNLTRHIIPGREKLSCEVIAIILPSRNAVPFLAQFQHLTPILRS